MTMKFQFNRPLLYALERHTNDKPHEILSFFYDLAQIMMDSGTAYFKSHGGTRRCAVMYPGTFICVSANLWAYGTTAELSVKLKAQNVDRFTLTGEQIKQKVMEAELLASEEPSFREPDLTANRGFYIQGREVLLKTEADGRKRKRMPKIDTSVIKDQNLLKILGLK